MAAPPALSSRSLFAPTVLVVLVALAACGVDETGGATPGEQDGGATGDASTSDSGSVTDGGTANDGSLGDGASEASVDGGGPCGGDAGVLCPVGHACTTESDCEGKCTAGKCAAPTHADGKLSPSLGETDVDCGGPTAPKCADDKTCAADGDCKSTACSAKKTCIAPSCKAGSAGVDTCGPGEVGAAVHESCCRALPLPATTTRRLDRYEITAGRLRAFVDAVTAMNAGVPNIRKFANDYAAAHPTSQLGEILASYPGLLDMLPDHAGPTNPLPLPVHLGAYPLDPINALDGCYVAPGAYGHSAYWQPAADLKPYGIGTVDGAGNPTGNRIYSKAELDTKAVQCVMPMMLAAFCAWDGGELARTSDYHEIWGNRPTLVGSQSVRIPWAALLPVGDFNWRNGHGDSCGNLAAWPGCLNPQPAHYAWPAGGDPANDDTPAIGAPGRFPLDITATVASGADPVGWYDVGGNLMEAAWPNSQAALNLGPSPVADVCDQTAAPGPGETACTRPNGNGVIRYSGPLPHIALVGYSFEAHARRSEAYLASATGAESTIPRGDLKPVTFQYGKVGGRCAR
ncbi:MAG: hypothetical protein JST00_21100 [Deltaproteobacteria bacterium]|nr:hypothetical protein [Deltaproteobacteria bacterium]